MRIMKFPAGTDTFFRGGAPRKAYRARKITLTSIGKLRRTFIYIRFLLHILIRGVKYNSDFNLHSVIAAIDVPIVAISAATRDFFIYTLYRFIRELERTDCEGI